MTVEKPPTSRRSLSIRVRRGLATLAGIVEASTARMILGIDEDSHLTRDERETVEDVELAVEWIRYVCSKRKAKPTRAA